MIQGSILGIESRTLQRTRSKHSVGGVHGAEYRLGGDLGICVVVLEREIRIQSAGVIRVLLGDDESTRMFMFMFISS